MVGKALMERTERHLDLRETEEAVAVVLDRADQNRQTVQFK